MKRRRNEVHRLSGDRANGERHTALNPARQRHDARRNLRMALLSGSRQVRRALVHGGGLITAVSKSVRRAPRFPRPSCRRARHRMRSRRHGVSPARPDGDRAHRYGPGHAGAQAQPETEQGGAGEIPKDLGRLLEQSGSDLGAESAFRSGHRGGCCVHRGIGGASGDGDGVADEGRRRCAAWLSG